ncbi:hypothetical protein, partial [Arsenicicoccus bolidensis]|uniref:hypothetical protein n=1 Tax=Arsenicicoccus bolidensis TaxID=229480 RepID=UPI0028A7B3DA
MDPREDTATAPQWSSGRGRSGRLLVRLAEFWRRLCGSRTVSFCDLASIHRWADGVALIVVSG